MKTKAIVSNIFKSLFFLFITGEPLKGHPGKENSTPRRMPHPQTGEQKEISRIVHTNRDRKGAIVSIIVLYNDGMMAQHPTTVIRKLSFEE